MKTKIFALFAAFPILFLTGCYDLKEIDETAYIVALGIDNGSKNNFSYTFQFSSPLSIMESSAEGQPEPKKEENSSVTTLTITAPDFYIAKNLTNNFLSKNIDMSHLKLIVFSAEVDESGITKHSQLLLREREVRPHTSIAISPNPASDYLKNVNPELESNTSKYYELMSLRSNNIYTPSQKLHDFVDSIKTRDRDTTLPIATKGEAVNDFPKDSNTLAWITPNDSEISAKHSVLCGTAVFRDGKLASAMDADSSMMFNFLSHNIENFVVSIKDKYNPAETLSFRIITARPAQFDVDLEKKEIHVSQKCEISFLGSHIPKGYPSKQALSDYALSILNSRVSDFLTYTYHTHKVDIFNLRDSIRKDFFLWKGWDSFDFENFYKTANFVVDIKNI
ncbi:MAG: hypothetical protein IKB32_03385 [Clostridia bacterium]|nr:hypothetical protein [Clostridia bacterium]